MLYVVILMPNFLKILNRPIERRQQVISYGVIVLFAVVASLFLIPNQIFFRTVWFVLALFVLFVFLSGLQGNQKIWTVISILSMSIFMLNGLFFGQSLFFYGAALLICGLATLRYPKVGIFTIIICTMWFERYFTLQSLVINNIPYKIYPLDFILIFLLVGILYRVIVHKWRWTWSNRFDWPILIFGLICTANILFVLLVNSNNPFQAFGSYKNYFLYSVFYVILIFVI